MPFVSFSVPILSSTERLWGLLVDKIQNPVKYVPAVRSSRVLDRTQDELVRELTTDAFRIVERIRASPDRLRVDFELIDHPLYTGHVINQISLLAAGRGQPVLTSILDWRFKKPALETNNKAIQDMVEGAVLQMKSIAENKFWPED